MTREEFKAFAAGNYIQGKATIDMTELTRYVDGAMMAWDFREKEKRDNKPTQSDGRPLPLKPFSTVEHL